MHSETIRARLLFILVLYEIGVISVCLYAGYNISVLNGGSIAFAVPLILVSLAEALRIPLSGWSTRLPWHGKLLSAIVLLAISALSFEALVLVFEVFIENRVTNISALERQVDVAKNAYDKKHAFLLARKEAVSDAQRIVDQLTAQSNALLKARPNSPALSGKTCGKGVTCYGDRQAQDTYKRQLAEDNQKQAQLTEERKAQQLRVDSLTAEANSIDLTHEQNVLDARRKSLAEEKAQSPMHRLTAALYGVSIDKVTSGQFEVLKKYAVFGLAGAFSVLSATVSWVAHMTPKSDKPSKLSRAIRSFLARRRKALVRTVTLETPGPERIVEVEKVVPVEVEKVITRWVPYDYNTGARMPFDEPKVSPLTAMKRAV